MGPYMGPYGRLWVLLDSLGRLRKLSVNFPQDFWTIFARFGSKTKFLIKFLDDSASFLLEKLKNHVILTKNPNICLKIQKNKKKKYINILGFLGFPRDPCGPVEPCGALWSPVEQQEQCRREAEGGERAR